MTEITEETGKLPNAAERFVLHWGDMGGQWGINRSISQIHALLYLSERPRTAEEIAAAEEADRLSCRVDHGELALARAQQRLHRLLHVRVGRQRGELGHHRRARRHAA